MSRAGGHLQHNRILGREGLSHPLLHVPQLHPLRTQHMVEFSVYPDGNQIVLVYIEADETSRNLSFLQYSGILLSQVSRSS
jgi:hypothetical protein